MPELDYRIPIIDRERFDQPYDTLPVDKQGNLFNEPLVRLADHGVFYHSYYDHAGGDNPPYYQAIDGAHDSGWLRQSLVAKLVAANQHLASHGVELVILDAWRSSQCQQGIWQFHFDDWRKRHPQATDEQCARYAGGFARNVSQFNPDEDKVACPAHMTGSAIDATLRRLDDGSWLDMGTRFEQIIDESYTDFYERQLLAGQIAEDDPRLHNRRLLHWAMSSQGILNDPWLFWHHDWGNQLWFRTRQALCGKTDQPAWYGYASPPPNTQHSSH